ncbi:MAG: head decoration protein [Lamprobacter sp.]|uniref:head decoration protein n=1 Tax=Lamprobacter sp. TaxID=3100796 RepID=UPI002B25BF4D|nr:head decoration protein [Lamprobacter sp.]MEA3641291.1 head decoration protein [Lamprobacter sp.]
MTTFTETPHAGAFIVSESNGTRSRATATLESGQDLLAGTVLGIVTASGKYTQFDQDGADGSETAAGILVYPTDATSADTACAAIVRDAEVHGDQLTWPADIEAGEKTTAIAQLASLGIIVR